MTPDEKLIAKLCSEDYERGRAALYFNAMTSLQAEVARLREGQFTEAEFQNLCHNTGVQAGRERFVAGCLAYQRQLFGPPNAVDVTAQVEVGNPDDELLPMYRCVCGEQFKPWEFNLPIYPDNPKQCPKCGRRLFFSQSVTVYELTEGATANETNSDHSGDSNHPVNSSSAGS